MDLRVHMCKWGNQLESCFSALKEDDGKLNWYEESRNGVKMFRK